jgi:hypothetical protein
VVGGSKLTWIVIEVILSSNISKICGAEGTIDSKGNTNQLNISKTFWAQKESKCHFEE